MAVQTQAPDADGGAKSVDGARLQGHCRERRSFVYVISAGADAQKIGITSVHPLTRMAGLQTAHHARLSLAGFVEVNDGEARRIERAAHNALHSKRLSGEWFTIDAGQAVQAIELASGVAAILPAEDMASVANGRGMTGEQMRMARALLRWRAQDLADRAGVGLATVQRAEKEDGPVQMIRSTADAIQRALEAAGVEFIPENGGGPGVRMRKG